MMMFLIIFALLVGVELGYFVIARRCGIVDKPNARSSHSRVVLRGGGVIFAVAVLLWFGTIALLAWRGDDIPAWLLGDALVSRSLFSDILRANWPFVLGLLLVAILSFVDDIRSLSDSVRLVGQFAAMGLMFWSLGLYGMKFWWVLLALVVCVGITNAYNFMDGINGITGGYSLSVLVPLLLMQHSLTVAEGSLIVTIILADLVFCWFNFRPKNMAKCFAGDVGSVSMAFAVLYLLGRVIVATGDLTYLVLLVVYGVDACLTIVHRIMLHENLGQAHRKHAYQLMANELGMSHIAVSLLYMGLQLVISLVFLLLVVPLGMLVHWLYLGGVVMVLSGAYLLFMKKYYPLHEEYLRSKV